MRTTHIAPLAAALLFAAPAFADGTEILGPPVGITVARGSALLTAGTGMWYKTEGKIELNVPLGVRVVQVIAYWEGQALTETEQGATDVVLLNDNPVRGTRIGGPTHFFSTAWTSSYRADVTALGLIANGDNVVTVKGLDFQKANNGLGLAVIVDDGINTTNIDLRDGNDCAFINFASPLDATVPVVYTFPTAAKDRTARLSLFLGSIAAERPSVIEIESGSNIVRHNDTLGNLDGPEWDTWEEDVTIPAGAGTLTVRILSKDSGEGRYTGKLPASLTWVMSGLVVPPGETRDGPCGGTPGFWKNHLALWDGVGSDDVTRRIKWTLKFNEVMGVTPQQSGLRDSATLLDAVRLRGGKLMALNRHAAAALANADTWLRYPYSLAEVIHMYRDAVGAIRGPETICSAHRKFEWANENICRF